MKRMFRYRESFLEIQSVDVIKETDKQVVWLRNGVEERSAKMSDSVSFHDSFEDAKQLAIIQQQGYIDRLQERITHHRKNIKKLSELKEQ